jgi:hypothetical protein
LQGENTGDGHAEKSEEGNFDLGFFLVRWSLQAIIQL